MSIRIPVTQTFNMAWMNPIVTTEQGQTTTASWTPSDKTMVGCISPWLGMTTTNEINQQNTIDAAGHPNLNATQTRIPAGLCPATNQKLYQTYCQLYDEVKLDGMTVSLSVLTPVGTADLPSLSIATGWDRKAGIAEIRPLQNYSTDKAFSNGGDLGINNTTKYPVTMVQKNYLMQISHDYMNSYDELIAGPNAVEATAINNSVAKIFRSCKASDLLEKATFHDGELEPWENNRANLFDQTLYPVSGSAAPAAGMPLQSPLVFAPVFYFACKRSSPAGQADDVITLQAEVNYYFTFRNPKFGGTSFDSSFTAANSMAREIAAGALVNSAARQPPPAGDMDDDGEEDTRMSGRSLEAYARNAGLLVDDEVDPETVSFDASTTSSSGRATKKGNKKHRNADTTDQVFDEATKTGFDPGMTVKRSETMAAKGSTTTTTSKK